MFQARCKYSKHFVNVSSELSTAWYLQRVANSRKKIIRDKYQPPYTTNNRNSSPADTYTRQTVQISKSVSYIPLIVARGNG